MKYQVHLIEDAEQDIFEIYSSIAFNDSSERAAYVYGGKKTCSTLETIPFRGHIPPELERLGIENFLEIHFKLYRIIYSVIGKRVFVHCVLDGRRNLQDLLQHRPVRQTI